MNGLGGGEQSWPASGVVNATYDANEARAGRKDLAMRGDEHWTPAGEQNDEAGEKERAARDPPPHPK